MEQSHSGLAHRCADPAVEGDAFGRRRGMPARWAFRPGAAGVGSRGRRVSRWSSCASCDRTRRRRARQRERPPGRTCDPSLGGACRGDRSWSGVPTWAVLGTHARRIVGRQRNRTRCWGAPSRGTYRACCRARRSDAVDGRSRRAAPGRDRRRQLCASKRCGCAEGLQARDRRSETQSDGAIRRLTPDNGGGVGRNWRTRDHDSQLLQARERYGG